MRSVTVKKPLIQMVETRFPEFKFSGDWGGTYGFVRRRPEGWYDYLPIDRSFQQYLDNAQGVLGLNWSLMGSGCNPGWYAWSTGDKWRIFAWNVRGKNDPEELSSPLAKPGLDQYILYQRNEQKFLPDALEVLADKIQRYAVPALDRLATLPITSSELKRWQRLSQQIGPHLDALDPVERDHLSRWLKAEARGKVADPPPYLRDWLEEIKALHGFAGEYDRSPILQMWVRHWFIHALFLHP